MPCCSSRRVLVGGFAATALSFVNFKDELASFVGSVLPLAREADCGDVMIVARSSGSDLCPARATRAGKGYTSRKRFLVIVSMMASRHFSGVVFEVLMCASARA